MTKINLVVALVCATLLFIHQCHHASAITKKPTNTIHVKGVDQCSSYEARVTCHHNNEWNFLYSTKD